MCESLERFSTALTEKMRSYAFLSFNLLKVFHSKDLRRVNEELSGKDRKVSVSKLSKEFLLNVLNYL
jgi:hypothetical protein